MGKKSKKGQKEGGGAAEQLQEQEVLKAVVLADSFSKRMFLPLSLETPRALLPICNVPLIEYTLEFLDASGVREAILFCAKQTSSLKDYIETHSKWSKKKRKGSTMKITVLVSEKCTSAGEALREICDLNIIRSDFILVSGDVVSNLRLDAVLEAHKKRVKEDRNAIMTMVFKRAGPYHRARGAEDELALAMNSNSGQLLYMDSLRGKKKVVLEEQLLKENECIELRHDLIDCCIDICTPEVLMQFRDNFDYQEIREQFVKMTLVDDIYGFKIFTHEITSAYAGRVKDLRTYDSVSKDIINRWTYPIVVDNNLFGATTYKCIQSPGTTYAEDGVSLSFSCQISEDCVIGEGTEVGSRTRINKSVIGRNCRIGSNVVIENSYIWGDVHIEDGAQISYSVIANNVVIGAKASINKGCVLSYGVCIAPEQNLAGGTRLTIVPETDAVEDDFDDYDGEDDSSSKEQSELESDSKVVGRSGRGRLYRHNNSYTSLELLGFDEESWLSHAISQDALLLDSSDEEDDSDFDSDAESDDIGIVTSAVKQLTDRRFQEFVEEVFSSATRLETEVVEFHNIKVEIDGIKMAYDRTFMDCAFAILTSVFEGADLSAPLKTWLSTIKKRLETFSGLLRAYVDDAQLDEVIQWVVDYCDSHEVFQPMFQFLVQFLYEEDVLDEDAILEWAAEHEGSKYVAQSQSFLKWLEDADEEDSDEDDSDEDDSSDDE